MSRLLQRTKLRLEYSIAMVDAYLADRQGDLDWSARCLRDARECRCMLEWMQVSDGGCPTMLNKLLCLIGWHDWVHLAHDNHVRLTRSCCHCRKHQEWKRSFVVGESWQ